jgi:hypothetical protein
LRHRFRLQWHGRLHAAYLDVSFLRQHGASASPSRRL